MSELNVALELLINLALLVALTVVSGFIDTRWPRDTRWGASLQGFLFGTVTIIGMLRALNQGPGVIFDGRSVMISLCALYFGPWAAAIAVVMLATGRIMLGGVGTATGILVALAAAMIGLAAHHRLRSEAKAPSSAQLYLLGIAVHIAMLALMFTLPGSGWVVIRQIGLPVIVMFPLATILAGKVLSDQVDAKRTLLLLRESEEKHRILLEDSPDPVFSLTSAGEYRYVNPAFAAGVGKPVHDIVGRTLWDVFPKEEADKRFASLEDVFRTGEQKVIEVRVPRAEGDHYYVTTISPVKDGAGKPLSVICSSKEITARKVAEVALKRSESRFRLFAELAPVGIMIADQDEKTIYVSPRFVEMFGYTIDDVPSVRAWWELAYRDEQTRNRVQREWEAMLALGRRDAATSNQLEFPVTCKNGTLRYIELRLAHAETVSVVVFVDVTERRNALESLSESERKYRSLINTTIDWVFEIDADAVFTYVSANVRDIMGYEEEEILGHTPFDFMTAEEAERVSGIFRDAMRAGARLAELDTTILTKDGRAVHFETNGIPLHVEGGGQRGYFGTCRDTSDRRRAEAERAHSHALLENLARLVPGVIYQYRLFPDGRSCFPWASPGMGMIYEVSPEDVKEDASLVFDRLYPEDRDRVSEAIERSARTLQAFYSEFRVILPRQGLRWRWSQAHPERTEDGGTLWHGIISDITERKTAEEERQALEGQLRQAMKMEAIGRLAGGVAHDFNNLLTSITGNVQLALLDVSPTDPTVESLQEIDKAAASAAALTMQLLAFSRNQLIEPRVIDLNRLVSSAHKMLVRLIGEDIELKTVCGERLGSVRVDPGQYEQVLVNLAVNARDAMPDGGTLTIETANIELDDAYCRHHGHTQPGRYVMLAVSDTGTGMGEEVRRHVFEPFFTTKPKGRGTGLGLATIYGAVKQAGGSIEVYSEEGEGTTFKIYLPRVDAPAKPFAEDIRAPKLPRGAETILVVEDEKSVRDMAIRILKRLGYSVLQASDGGQALALAAEYRGRIDLLMTDVVMPGLNGRQLAERFAVIHPESKVLFTSGYPENAIANHGVIDEGLSFIGKPYTPYSLAMKLREVIGEAGGEPGVAGQATTEASESTE